MIESDKIMDLSDGKVLYDDLRNRIEEKNTKVATEIEIKEGENNDSFITPKKLDKATFYGLAKAAGDTTQKNSNNHCGKYTIEAKEAIRNMLGIKKFIDGSEMENDYFNSNEFNIPIELAETKSPIIKDSIDHYPIEMYFELPPLTGNYYYKTIIIYIRGFYTNQIYTYYINLDSSENIQSANVDINKEEIYISNISNIDNNLKNLSLNWDENEYTYANYPTSLAEMKITITSQYVVLGGTSTIGMAIEPKYIKYAVRPYAYLNNNAILNEVVASPAQIRIDNTIIASKRLYTNDLFTIRGKLYKATQDIANGETINTSGSSQNCIEATIADEFLRPSELQNLVQDDIIAHSEINNTATKSYSIGDLFVMDGKLYKATAAIAQNDAIVVEGSGQNCEEVSVADEFARSSDIPTVPVQDIQVNGTSVLSNGVANIGIADANNLGVVKVNVVNGIEKSSSNTLITVPATPDELRQNSARYRVVTPNNIDSATFYGLAKAAGDSTQSSSSNAVGNYTENAKSAIRSMLGATSSDVIAVQDTTPTSFDTKIWITETAPSTVTVPTVAEMESALGDYVTKSNSVFNDTISGGRKEGTVVGQYSFAFGYEVEANNSFSHSEGAMTIASGSGSHAEGVSTRAIGNVAHAEGYGTSAKGTYSHAETNGSVAYGQSSHAEGDHTLAIGYNSHSEGVGTLALGNNAHAEGYCLAANIQLTGTANTTQYTFTVPSNNWEIEINDIIYYSTIVKYVKVTAVNNDNNIVTVNESFGDALSNVNVLIYRYYAGNNAHSENGQTMASGNYSHAQGKYTIANTSIEDVSGCYNVKTNIYPTWVANTSYNVGDRITKETSSYECNTVNNDSAWNVEKWTLLQYNGLYSTVVGNGLDEEHRSNSYALDWHGNGHYAGDVYVECNNDSTGGTKLAKVSDIAVNDVQVNGVSVLSNGVANVPIASSSALGVVKIPAESASGLTIVSGELKVYPAAEGSIKSSSTSRYPITPAHVHEAAFYGLAKAAGDATQSVSNNAIGSYTNEAKAAIQSMLGVEGNVTVVNISDTNPVITTLPNTRYICGEVSTISITPYSFGIIDVVFTSGTSAAILTLPSTVIMPEWFDASNLEQNRIYEINISDGIYGSVMSWPS